MYLPDELPKPGILPAMTLPTPAPLPRRIQSTTGRWISDLRGMKFGSLTVLSYNGPDAAGNSLWLCKCECGEERIISAAQLNARLKTKCATCARARPRKLVPHALKWSNPEKAAMLRTVAPMKRGATIRGAPWELSPDEAVRLITAPCHYCGTPPRTRIRDTSFYRNGIDRKDNSKGYTKDNCVPCCWRCNRAKNILSADEFIELARGIAAQHPSKPPSHPVSTQLGDLH